MPKDTFNIHAEVNRRIKAEKICRVMKYLTDDISTSLQVARTMNKEQRKRVARMARVTPPSEDTWKIVIEMLEADASLLKELKGLMKLRNRMVSLMLTVRDNRAALEYFTSTKTGGKEGTKYRAQLREILEILDSKE